MFYAIIKICHDKSSIIVTIFWDWLKYLTQLCLINTNVFFQLIWYYKPVLSQSFHIKIYFISFFIMLWYFIRKELTYGLS